MSNRIPSMFALAATLALAACGGAPEAAPTGPAPAELPVARLDMEPLDFVRHAPGAFVVVDLDRNRLAFMDGRRVVWEAPVGTGTGLRLQGEGQDWEFDTPRGVFQIQYKEEMPVWYLPDWYFIEKGRPVPPSDSPSRKLHGQLGVAAVYLGRDLAIHGTNHPELLGQRVSHGCIRLENRFVQRLYHNVQIGTPVVIVGGDNLEPVSAENVATPKGPGIVVRDTLGARSTAVLLERLEQQLAVAGAPAEWVPTASRLITRGLRDDADALRGLLSLAGHGTEQVRGEYATFLADAFSRGPLRVVVSLARIDAAERERAARAIVDATLRLHPGRPGEPGAPWPTARVPLSMLGPDGSDGWHALRAAEQTYHARYAAGAAVTSGDRE